MTIESPLLQAPSTPKRVVVSGTHVAHGSYFTITHVYQQSVTAFVGCDSGRETNMNVRALREYAALYAALADALEGK